MKIAIVGAGISGLGCAHALSKIPEIDLTLYEGGSHIGGHSNTVDFSIETPQGNITHGVDTGFLVFNRKTYPRLMRLFEEIKVPIAPSEMSFSVSIDASEKTGGAKKLSGLAMISTLSLGKDQTYCPLLFGGWLMTSCALIVLPPSWPKNKSLQNWNTLSPMSA